MEDGQRNQNKEPLVSQSCADAAAEHVPSEEEQLRWAMSQSIAAADHSGMLTSATQSSPMVVAMYEETHQLQERLTQTQAQLADVSARLAFTEDQLQDYKTRNQALSESLQVAQALSLSGGVDTYPQSQQPPDPCLAKELQAKIEMLEAKLALVSPSAKDCPEISKWLDEVKPGYGARFAKAFWKAGYEDFQDIYSIPKESLTREVNQIVQHLKFEGAKVPQERRIRDALLAVAQGGCSALPLSSESACPAATPLPQCVANLSVQEWLDNIQNGFGARFCKAFASVGYETVDDIAHAPPGASSMEGIAFHLTTLGARQPQIRQIRDAIKNVASIGGDACPSSEVPATTCTQSSLDEQFEQIS